MEKSRPSIDLSGEEARSVREKCALKRLVDKGSTVWAEEADPRGMVFISVECLGRRNR